MSGGMPPDTETLAYKIQTPGNHQKEILQHSEHGESLKSRSIIRIDKSRRMRWAGKYGTYGGERNAYSLSDAEASREHVIW
jgi:hypothetical protein